MREGDCVVTNFGTGFLRRAGQFWHVELDGGRTVPTNLCKYIWSIDG